MSIPRAGTIVKQDQLGDTHYTMRLATLISWLVTAGLGAFMLRTWLARGGLGRERARAGGLPPPLIFGHAALAVTGLLLWAGYAVSAARPVAWVAIGMMMLAIALGLCTVTLWTPYPARRPGERLPSPWGVAEVVIPDTAAAAVEAVRATDARLEEPEQVTDEMISQLLSEPVAARRVAPIRPDPAVLVPIAHGFMAISTFVLAVMTATT
jgi:hypothetical protein